MDDLDHSVLIAERDWDSFYEESEECSIQQARLAGLDDSGLSDTDDEKNSTQKPVLPSQTDTGTPEEERGAASQALSAVDDREVGKASEDSECFCCKSDLETTAPMSLNDSTATCACLISDSSLNDMPPNDGQQNSASDTKNIKRHDQSHSEDKFSQVVDEPITVTSSSCTPDMEYADSAEGETVTKVVESLATPKKEKERWFVTVNDSPVKQTPAKEPEEEGCEKSTVPKTKVETYAFSIQSKGTTDVPTENPENNPFPSLNTQPSLILMQSSQLQANIPEVPMTQLATDQSTVMGLTNDPKSNQDITPQNQPVTNNSSDVNNDPKENSSRFILGVSSTICLLDEQHNQQASQEEEKMSSIQETHNLEPPTKSLKAAVGPSRPIYALSSFWDEMEKLTINDILHLRVADNKSPLSGSTYSEENDVHLQDRDLVDSKDASLQDSSIVDESADSDYFTHLDDFKPDRSSCEFSTLSDFDDEFLQIINTSANPSPAPQNLRQTESFLESTYTSELEITTVNNESESEDVIMLCPQNGSPLYLYPATEAQSVFHIHKPDCIGGPFELECIRKTPSPVLSVGNILADQCPLLFSEIVDGEGFQKMNPDRCSPVVSFYSSKKLSVPETYDDFFTDFVVGNLFFPSIQDQTVPIPIFSSSRSVVRDLVFPEVEELMESDFEDNNCPIRVMTRFSNQPERSTSPSGTPNLFFFTSQRRNWRSLLSLRRISFIGKGSAWCQKVSSWIFPKEAKLMSHVSRAQPVPHLFHLKDQALVQCVEQQTYVQHTASILKREGLFFSIKQADMCLVCIAFASWVLKSYNTQSADMWKAALLANVSALSAIQYLRKHEKKEVHEDDP
ncbi:uncharacterized protein perm1b [Salminus brasiliensis]|uniref:uncharacterized protein perm1b n=1 Tax=Salminus brasiliensis TaxID=930266 RepID=UPI003B82E06C